MRQPPVAEMTGAVRESFSWIVLSVNDSHVLRRHAQSLLSESIQGAQQTCHGLVDMLFHDFPAEVFLQRPGVVQALCTLVESDKTPLPAEAFACLVALTAKLVVRFRQTSVMPVEDGGEDHSRHADCNMSIPYAYPKSSFTSMWDVSSYSSSSTSLDSSCSSSSSALLPTAMETAEETMELQLRQLTLPVYLCAVMDCCLNALGEEMILGAGKPLLLLDQTSCLLRSVTGPSVWTSAAAGDIKVAEHLLHSLKTLGNRVLYHAKRTERNFHEAKQARLIYAGLVKTVFTLLDLIPIEHVENLPGSLRACLPWICQDEALAVSYPAVRLRCLKYLEITHPPGFEAYNAAREVCAAMSAASDFLDSFHPDTQVSLPALAQRAVRGIPSLVYHQSQHFILQCLRLCCFAFRTHQDNPRPFVKLTVRLLAHPSIAVRKQSYEVLCDFVSSFLNVETAANPTHHPGSDALFLMSTEVLREIVLYGLFQQETIIFAQQLLLLLSQKILIRNHSIWNRLKTAIRPLFCGVFVHADLETNFGQRVLTWSRNQSDDEALFDRTIRIRAAFCMLYHQDRIVRGQASDLVLQHINRKIPFHCDTLRPEAQYSLVDSPAETSIEALERSMKIWTDTRMDMLVRWTALRQIQEQLRSPDAHVGFARLCGPETLVSMLKLVAEGTEREWTSENMAMLMETLLLVLHHGDKWRTEISNDVDLYEHVIYIFSLVPTETALWSSIQAIASSIIFLLTFSDMIIRRDGALSICCTFYRHIQSPCHIMFHDLHPKQTKGTSCDLLRSPVGEMLVLHWNMRTKGGIEKLLMDDVTDSQLDYAPRLMLDERAKMMSRVSHPVHGFEAACRALETAGSHTEAIQALDNMAVYQMMWAFMTRKDKDAIPDASESLLRYTTVLPHNSSDHNLLSAVVEFVTVAGEKGLRARCTASAARWVHGLIRDQRSLYMEAVRKTNKELSLLAAGKASLRVPYIASCKALMRSSWKLFGTVASVINGDEWDIAQILEVFVDTLRMALNGPLHDFGAVGSACRCIALFSGIPSVARQPESIAFVPSLIGCVLALSRNNSDLALSFLARSIIKSAALALMNLVTFQVENNMFPAMLESWKTEQGDLLWLLPLWANRDPVTRSSAIDIAGGLCCTREGRRLVIQCFRFIPGGVWNATLSFLFSAEEPDMVKWSAVKLLTVLVQSDIRRSDLRLREVDGSRDLEGPEALVAILDQLEFYRVICQLLQDYNHARDDRFVADYLVAAVFGLCGALVKRLGCIIIARLHEAKLFHAALHVCFLARKFAIRSPYLPDRLDLFAKLYGLVAVAVNMDESIAEVAAHNMHAAGAAFCLLDVNIADLSRTRTLWLNIYTALSLCLRNVTAKDGVWKFVFDYHKTLFENFKFVLNLVKTEPDNQKLQIALVCFAEVSTEAERSEVNDFLWKSVTDQEEDTVGGVLTNFLVRKFDEPSTWEVPSWSELLKRLLLRYEQVRKVAMECGLVETVIDNLLEMDSTISKDLHVHSRSVLKKKMTESIKIFLELLMNLMFCNVEAKRLAAKKGLASVLISLWITVICDTESLHILFLRLLCTYGARCQESLASFVRESEHYHTMPLTLFHVIITDLEEQLALPLPHPNIAPLLFDLLGQMALNPQCRVFIRKSVSVKRAMPIPSPRKPRVHQVLDAMWLHVLGNLSFFEDGLVVVLAREDICTMLFDYLEIDGLFKEIYVSSMLILRNLAFSKKGMARLTGARGVLARLLRLSSLHAEPKVRLYALSCLLEVLHDQVKLRHAAKAISFDELNHARPDDEPQMFDLRARLISSLDDRPDNPSPDRT